MVSELYPGRSAVVCEMLDAWKDRNDCVKRGRNHPDPRKSEFWRGAADSDRDWLNSLRRVREALREAR
jgi:hypothetical protein